MSRILFAIKQENDSALVSPPLSVPSSLNTSYYSFSSERESTSSSSSFNRVSPVLLWVIVIIAVIFFVCGLLHLLVRFLKKRPSFSPIFHSNRFPETSGTQSLQRQLQQLFRLHDSGLDQAFIDALPVFHYKDIMGTKEPFDCAVCLCEFSNQDKLRLLPVCSHAFHIDCIDTWLLSNSTCPLCRGTLVGSNLLSTNQLFNLDASREASNGVLNVEEHGSSNCQRPTVIQETDTDRRIFSVRLGKFRSLNELNKQESRLETGEGETSRSNLDARRCYSMGTVQYVVRDSNLLVSLSFEDQNGKGDNTCSPVDGNVEYKKIRGKTRGDSFSVSKIWLWSKSSRFPSSSTAYVDTSSLPIR
ncbi:hypothetical protein K2173_022850 [Erythroxylum novogranatense]|uniref:RING-type E3 ubiquitin transferase n=1 Tax=Erythroxylum novogranatense TaxID=1862640 RepID=A0AAV8SNS5_9ROSI|nr:hypothetical protein K2173_022850 [Erythroxylum novogranatense]